jgi:MoxR-like ATPase
MESLNNFKLEYTGQAYHKKQQIEGQYRIPYLPHPESIEAVNLAIYLERPLLLKGEPGCGKTQLAYSVAEELNLPIETWHIKSTSQARDGLYLYDTVGRLRDSQLAANQTINQQELSRLKDPSTYIEWGPLGRAFQNNKRTVVLIDEIDKADIDFPNDLLLELEHCKFFVQETGEFVEATSKPIVFITSNDEKDLPDAFLRRCLFHYIEFPDLDRLRAILEAHFPNSPGQLVNQATDRFLELRDKMQEDKGSSGKKISTSELIDWFKVLRRYSDDEILAKLNGTLPYPGVLLKSWDDHIRYLGERDEH